MYFHVFFVNDQQNPETDIICDDCLSSITLNLEQKGTQEEAKRDEIQKNSDRLEKDIIKTEKKLKELKFDPKLEEKLQQELKELEKLEHEQKKDLEELGKLQIKTEKEVEAFWEDTIGFERKLLLLNEKKNAASNRLKELESNQDRLSKINVLNDLISISTEHEVAKVNDLQLGKTFQASQV